METEHAATDPDATQSVKATAPVIESRTEENPDNTLTIVVVIVIAVAAVGTTAFFVIRKKR